MKILGPSIQHPISSEVDLFGRDRLIDGVISILESSEDPLAIAVDEPWGAGKTVFARRLERKARENGYRVIYYDAFASDYHSDVFLSLSASLLEEIGSTTKDAVEIKDRAKALLKIGGRLAAKAAVRAATAGLVKSSDLSEASAEVAAEIGDEFEAEFDSYIDKRLTSVRDDKMLFDKFREKISSISSPPNGSKTLFIIDDLDRCRPDHALSIVEISKHFFSVENVYFLLMCQMDYLSACVQGRYGASIDANLYLEKFIQAKITFPVLNDHEKEKAVKSFIYKILENFPDDGEQGQFSSGMVNFLVRVSSIRGYSLRRIERVMTQFGLCLMFSTASEFRLGALLYVLCDLKISNPALFKKSKNGTLDWIDLAEYYRFDDKNDNWYVRWLKFFFGEYSQTSEQDRESLRNTLWQYSLPDSPREVGIYLANNVVDRIGR